MFRQTAFGMALSTLVLASGMMTAPVTSNNSTKKIIHTQSFKTSSQAAMSNFDSQNSTLEKLVFEQINQYRASQGLSQLTLNASITKQARIHSQNMAKGTVKFSHHGFEQRVKAIPLKYDSAGENVAFNIGYSDPAHQAVVGWLNSPGHLKNIQGKYKLTGVGVATNAKGEVYLTQIFINTR
ncbi:CAP domain-containing protein [Sphaerospermopsis aphanizomenoides BCCUSP55]|uniref:CAP domain-containing protein n=1 Tax=Sphaerospermopsis aphanizomenoides TaxID=459663 RepID=UPI000AEE1299|nr:CAP domain-containing protein [Sphaerospermopsis aphanizomenoides]MBK1990382.1 CAP domain-containing protein [Sphaerospermopsis aphanizomenoides BCCUSP55]